MWARTFELMLGIWLAISWIIFDYQEPEFYLIWHDLLCFLFIGGFSLLSYIEKCRHIHLLNFLIGAWLFGFSYYVRHLGLEAAAQNYMFISLLLIIFSIIPSHARQPPYQWIKFMNDRQL